MLPNGERARLNITYPKWLQPYLERSEILRALVQKCEAGDTDAKIARGWDAPEEDIYGLRRHWSIFRDDECPVCGSKEYDGETCENEHCISNR